MFFTKEDIQKLKLCLLIEGKKDTDFPIAETINPEDWIAFVKTGEGESGFLNKKITILNLFKDIMRRIENIEEALLNSGTDVRPPVDLEDKIWYLGQITRNADGFEALTVNELFLASQPYSALNNLEVEITITNSCWFAMLPEGVEPAGADYTSGGLESTFTKTEIENGFLSDVYHDDVIIDGLTYKVYVNRNDGMEETSITGHFRIQYN